MKNKIIKFLGIIFIGCAAFRTHAGGPAGTISAEVGDMTAGSVGRNVSREAGEMASEAAHVANTRGFVFRKPKLTPAPAAEEFNPKLLHPLDAPKINALEQNIQRAQQGLKNQPNYTKFQDEELGPLERKEAQLKRDIAETQTQYDQLVRKAYKEELTKPENDQWQAHDAKVTALKETMNQRLKSIQSFKENPRAYKSPQARIAIQAAKEAMGHGASLIKPAAGTEGLIDSQRATQTEHGEMQLVAGEALSKKPVTSSGLALSPGKQIATRTTREVPLTGSQRNLLTENLRVPPVSPPSPGESIFDITGQGSAQPRQRAFTRAPSPTETPTTPVTNLEVPRPNPTQTRGSVGGTTSESVTGPAATTAGARQAQPALEVPAVGSASRPGQKTPEEIQAQTEAYRAQQADNSKLTYAGKRSRNPFGGNRPLAQETSQGSQLEREAEQRAGQPELSSQSKAPRGPVLNADLKAPAPQTREQFVAEHAPKGPSTGSEQPGPNPGRPKVKIEAPRAAPAQSEVRNPFGGSGTMKEEQNRNAVNPFHGISHETHQRLLEEQTRHITGQQQRAARPMVHQITHPRVTEPIAQPM